MIDTNEPIDMGATLKPWEQAEQDLTGISVATSVALKPWEQAKQDLQPGYGIAQGGMTTEQRDLIRRSFAENDPLLTIQDEKKHRYIENLCLGDVDGGEARKKKIALANYYSMHHPEAAGFIYENIEGAIKRYEGKEMSVDQAYASVAEMFQPQDYSMNRYEAAAKAGSVGAAKSAVNAITFLSRELAGFMGRRIEKAFNSIYSGEGSLEDVNPFLTGEGAMREIEEYWQPYKKALTDTENFYSEQMRMPEGGWVLNSDGFADFVENGTVALVNYLPQLAGQLAMTMGTGSVAPLAFVYGVDGYYDIKEDEELGDVSEGKALLYGLGIGLINGALEKITLDVATGKVTEKFAKEGLKKGLGNAVKYLAITTLKEGAEEGIEEFAENLLDIGFGRRGETEDWTAGRWMKELFQGVPEAGFLGAVTGFGMGTMPMGAMKKLAVENERARQVIESRIGDLEAKENLTPEEEADLHWLKLLGDADPEDVRKAAFMLMYQELTMPQTETAAPETAATDTAEEPGAETAAETGSVPTETEAEPGAIQASEAAEEGEAEASARAERELKMRRELPHNPADTAAEVEKWKNLFPNANIQTTDAWTPEQIRILRQRGVLAPEKAQGLFDIKTNTVILNVSNLRPSEVGFKVLHEVGLHYGIRKAFGDEAANTLFLAVFDAMQDSPFMQRIIDAYKLRTPMLDENGEAIYNPDGTPLFDDMTDAQKAEAAEEFLAFAAETYGVPIDEIYADNRAEIDKWGREHGRDTHDWNEKRRMTREWMAETGFKPERPGWWKQLISQIRVWLAEHGFGHLREADIETIIQDAFRGASKTNRTNQANGEARFSAGQIPYYMVPFDKAVDEAVSGNDKSSAPVFVDQTPEILQELGFAALPVMMGKRHLQLNYLDEKEFKKRIGPMRHGEHAHALGDEIKKVKNALKQPLAVIANTGATAKGDSVMVLTEINTKDGKVVVPILVSSKAATASGNINAHIVLTMYGKKNWMKYYNDALNLEKSGKVGIFYVDTKKASSYTTLSLPVSRRKGGRTGFYHTIHDPGSPVKSKIKKNTETLQFKRWFGKSMMVDANGDPLVMYKGITESTVPPYDGNTYPRHKIPTFRKDNKQWLEVSSFWTYDKAFAERWASMLGSDGKGRVIEAYLRIENPYIIDAKGEYAGNIQFHEGNEEYMQAIEDPQYDGVIIRNTADEGDIVIVKDSNQIKSATDNIGTYDNNNPDIRYSVSPVYTGSAADYDVPDLNYVGTGEGAQVYGWGLYGSAERGVGEWYAKTDVRRKGKGLSPYQYAHDKVRAAFTMKGGRVLDDIEVFNSTADKTDLENAWEDIVYELDDWVEDKYRNDFSGTIGAEQIRDAAIKKIQWRIDAWSNFSTNETYKENYERYKKDLSYLLDEDKKGELEFHDIEIKQDKGRNLYRQTFWPDKEENLLDWDNKITPEQTEQIQRQLEKERVFDEIPKDEREMILFGRRGEREDNLVYLKNYLPLINGQSVLEGKTLYYALERALGSPKAASEFLYRAGIDGVTYIGHESGARNYVAFSDKDIRVDEHIRFSVGGVDENLIVVHNVSEQKLRDAIRLGALPVPSIGIIDAEKSDFTDYGRITLVGDRDLIDPRRQSNKVFDADIYSPRRPTIERIYSDEEFDRALAVIAPYETHEPDSSLSIQHLIHLHKDRMVNRDFEDELKNADAVRAWYASTREGDEKFEDWWIRVATPALDLHPRERIFDGYTNNGRRYLPATLESIVRIMTRKVKDGEDFFYGLGNFRALMSKKFKSISEIQKNRDRIVSGEDYKKIKEEFNEELEELLDSIQSAIHGDRVSRSYDMAVDLLRAMAEGPRKRENREWLIEALGYDNPIYKDMAEFLMKLKSMPTPLFEAKPQRAVYLDEFKAAVVPAETSNDILTALEQSGVKVYTYTDDAERKATLQKATQDQNLRFSLGDIDGNEAARTYIDIIKPYVPFDVHDKDGAYYAQILKEKAGVDLEPEDAMQIAQEAWHERRKASVKKSWDQAYTYFAQSNPLFDFIVNSEGIDVIRPSHRFEGEDYSGSFISPAFVKYSEKKSRNSFKTERGYLNYLQRRERELKNAEGEYSDELAKRYVMEHGGDELDVEQQIIDLFRNLKRTDIRSSYAQFKRDNFARDRMEQAEYEAMMEDIFQRELDDKVVSILSAGVPVVTPDWVAENRDVYKELYKRLLSKDGKEAPYTPSQKDIEAMNSALIQEGADAATYAKAYKEARAASAREWMEKVSELRQKVIEGKENAMKLQREAAALLKRAGLEGDRSFSARIINLMGFQTEARRQKAFDQLMSDILAAGTAAKQMKVYDRLQERLQQLGRRADVGRKAIGVRDEATQIQIDKIRDIAAMSTYEIAARQSELQDAINAAQEHGESSVEYEEEMALLSKYGDLANKTAAELTLALADLNELAVTGKRKIRERLMERQGQDRMRIQESVDLINGGNFAMMGDLDELENRRNQEDGTMKATAAFDLFSGFNLWGKLTALNLAGNKNIRDTVFYRMMEQTHECARNQDTMNEKHQNDTLAAIDRIFGTKGAFERAAKLQELRKVQDKTGVMRRYIDREKKIEYRKMSLDEARQLLADYDNKTSAGERPALKDYEAEAIRHQLLVYDRKLDKKATEYLDSVTEKLIQMAEEEKERGEKTVVIPVPKYTAESELKLSQMQALYQYLMWQQKNTRYKMVFNGWTEESIKQLEGFLTPETMAFGAWMTEQLEADRADIDPVYERLYMTAFPHVESYFPAVYHHRGQNTRLGNAQGVDLGAAGAGGQAMAFSPGALRQRVFHMSELRNVDALNVFQNHRMIMTHFVTHGEAARELRAVFANKDVKQAIIEQLGQKQYSSLTEDIADFINGGHVQIDKAAVLRGLYSAAVRSKMMINITSGIKQTLGGLTYLQDIPLKDFVAGVNYAVAHPKEVWQTLGKTEYFQNRWRSGSNRDLRMLLDRAGKNGQMDVLMEKADTLSSIPLRLGDAGAVLFGGYAVYRYNYQQGIKRGLSEAEAKRRALLEWEMSTERTQQSSQVHMQNKIQKGNTLERILSTYLSNQILMWNHYAPRFFKGDFKGGARGMLTAAITSVAMTTMNQLFRKGIWVDDWEFWDYFWEYLADVLNGSGAAGVYLERGIESARAYGRGKDVLQGDEERAARAVQNLLAAPFSDKDYETGFQDAIDILTFTGYFYAPITPALSAVREGRKTKNFWQRLFNRDEDE